MFGMLQPDKQEVGNRLKQVKEQLNLSFSDFGNRLGLKKPTVSSYVQGYNLAPLNVIKKVAKISDKSIGWFYFGTIEEYLTQYLTLRGEGELLNDHPEVIEEIKTIFYTDDFKNLGWENEVGYPAEEFVDDCFADIAYKIMKNSITQLTKKEVENLDRFKALNPAKKEELTILVAQKAFDYVWDIEPLKYGDRRILQIVQNMLEQVEVEEDIKYNDGFLVGKLIDILDDNEETEDIIRLLSKALTQKGFSTFFGGKELVEILQSIRPALIELYAEKDENDFYDWFEK